LSPPPSRSPLRGEIWWAHFATDTPGKNRPAVIVSQNGRNQHPRAGSVLAIPLSTSVQRLGPWHLSLTAGETGLREDSVAWAENVSAVGKEHLLEPIPGHRPLTNTKVCELAGLVRIAMGCAE
jgi:mRNA-degrading endonuclease toxin of MazEF toxin-antitoxin module